MYLYKIKPPESLVAFLIALITFTTIKVLTCITFNIRDILTLKR